MKPEETAFTLRQCLSGDELAACDDDLGEMISRLDEKFVNPSKLIDSIISEIKNFEELMWMITKELSMLLI